LKVSTRGNGINERDFLGGEAIRVILVFVTRGARKGHRRDHLQVGARPFG
jgi:hypothetical protein